MIKAKLEPVTGPVFTLNNSLFLIPLGQLYPEYLNTQLIWLPLDPTPQCNTVQSECDPITVRSRSTEADAPELGSVL